ncbi:MAG: hypothetical protein ABW168_02210 [Sedimenticola sp.]
MNTEIYKRPQSELVLENQIQTKHKSFLTRAFHGEIKLWQAFWLVYVLGLLLSLFIVVVPELIVLSLYQVRLPHALTFIPFLVIFLFSLVALWRSAPDPKISILGALTKILVILSGIWCVYVMNNILTG